MVVITARSVPSRLTRRHLNRVLLHRQLLANPSGSGVEDAVAHLAGLQAQVPKDPYVGLWSRLAGFTQDDLARPLTGRRLARVALMRSTIHLVTAEDLWLLRPAVQQPLDRDLFRNATFGPHVEGMDLDALIAEARAVLREEPLTSTELGQRLLRRWPGRDPRSMAHAVRNLEPLIQVPPRGLWGMPGQPRLAAARDWLPAPHSPASSSAAGSPAREAAARQSMVLRYLAAHGPASVRDMQAWAGVTRLAEVVEPLRPRLRRYLDEDGRELFDLPEAALAAADAPAPARLLPEYDNALLGYADRRRIMPDGVTFTSYAAALRARSVLRGGVLSGGFLRGTWSVRAPAEAGGAHVLLAEPFAGVTFEDPADVEREARRLLAWVTGAAGESRVEIGGAHRELHSCGLPRGAPGLAPRSQAAPGPAVPAVSRLPCWSRGGCRAPSSASPCHRIRGR